MTGGNRIGREVEELKRIEHCHSEPKGGISQGNVDADAVGGDEKGDKSRITGHEFICVNLYSDL